MNDDIDEASFEPTNEFGERLAEVGRYHTLAEAGDRGLVVLAMGYGYWILPCGAGFTLCVEPGIAEAARKQIALSEAENEAWPPRPEDSEVEPRAGLSSLFVFAGILAGVHLATISSGTSALREAGQMDAVALISRGEWWRLFTALTLHADLGHLASNLGSGAFFAHFASRRFGTGAAWLLIVLTGALGNLATALFYFPGEHLSIGASTAVFGALGLLAIPGMQAARTRTGKSKGGRAGLISLAAAAVILGLYGAGGIRTDVLAHLGGFACGVVLGWLTSKVPRKCLAAPVAQALSGTGAIALIAVSWWMAWLLGA